VEQLEKQVESLKSSSIQLEHTLSRQKIELDKRRAEAAQFETQVIDLQQDKSELQVIMLVCNLNASVQARLKVRARDVEKLQAELGDVRKDVHMKEIYIRQLSAHAAGVARADEQAATLTHMQAKVRNYRKRHRRWLTA
jgi:DNA repair exonuclease SbcCD ATPase subunit